MRQLMSLYLSCANVVSTEPEQLSPCSRFVKTSCPPSAPLVACTVYDVFSLPRFVHVETGESKRSLSAFYNSNNVSNWNGHLFSLLPHSWGSSFSYSWSLSLSLSLSLANIAVCFLFPQLVCALHRLSSDIKFQFMDLKGRHAILGTFFSVPLLPFSFWDMSSPKT